MAKAAQSESYGALLLRAIAVLDPNQGLVSLEGRDRSTIPGPEWRRLRDQLVWPGGGKC
jgi:hypothetical protein